MRVRFRKIDLETYTPNERTYVSPGQIFLSPEKDYEVHAISVYDGIVFLQVVDDLETPIFLPRMPFDVADMRVPQDWICNAFPKGVVQFVLGPAFVAESLDSYEAMIDQRRMQVDSFWKRVDSMKGD